MIVREGWVDNRGVRLHYLESNPDTAPAYTPVVYIPAAVSAAETFRPEMAALAPRRCISISLHGRGKSDAPHSGYSFNDHIEDIEALVEQLGLNHFCLMAWSLGVPYSVGYAARHPERVGGLVLLDYPARYPRFRPEWAERWSDPSFRLKPFVTQALQQESSEVPLWDSLDRIECPVLVIGGGKPEALLKPEHIEKYRQHLRVVDVVVFSDSGHNPSQPDYERFIRTINSFLLRIDAQSPRDVD